MARICRDIQRKDVVLSKEFGPREVIGYNSEKLGMVVILNTSILLYLRFFLTLISST